MGKISLCFTIVSTFACFARVWGWGNGSIWLKNIKKWRALFTNFNFKFEIWIIYYFKLFQGFGKSGAARKTVREKNSCPHLTERLKQAFVIYTVWKAGAGVILTSMIMPGRYQIQINAGVQFNTQPKGFTDPFHSP